jgi:Ni,Fe-hydrogenase maturation factor
MWELKRFSTLTTWLVVYKKSIIPLDDVVVVDAVDFRGDELGWVRRVRDEMRMGWASSDGLCVGVIG